jgi:hypothetical protein
MAVIVNKNTQGTPISGVGRLSSQSIRHVEAPRLYLLATSAGSTTTDLLINCPVQNYFVKSNGATPTILGSGSTNQWLDLGIVEGFLKVGYTKKVQEIKTGIDKVFRTAYVNEKVGTFECSLSQFSDYVLEKVSGLTASVITAGSIINYQAGQEDLNQCGILLVSQNKLDGQEWQFFNPNAFINFVYEEKGDALMLKMTAILPFFTAVGQTTQSMFSTTVFA